MSTVHVVVPEGIDDPTRPSGGNRYDRRICDGLAARGWDVRELPVSGSWPAPDTAALSALARALSGLPDDGLVVVDGLIASCAPTVLVPQASRLRLVVLVHMPLGDRDGAAVAERAVLTRARAVLATSRWTRRWLLDRYCLPPGAVHVAQPGVDLLDPSPASPGGGRLLCVAALVPQKGQHLLLEALAGITGPAWCCTLVGSPHSDPPFAARLRQLAGTLGIADRVRFAGSCPPDQVGRAYQSADLLVLPSCAETYGMAVTEALAAGVPVLATAVGGVPEALGETDVGLPGLLVAPGDRPALTAALSAWLTTPDLRHRLTGAALRRRSTLRGWGAASERVAAVLSAVREEPSGPGLCASL
ncbi:glycosyltransferase family 4 protein [Geodermatophilus ruber]|uniref:glycosyltransferase family 4 protein n=1 Tax=Geodermatophilus ruber TaxID=504800 RepID=UPI000B8602AD|nr:glycosyltransferase family 4 protein [Geodermatophilus ruber]